MSEQPVHEGITHRTGERFASPPMQDILVPMDHHGLRGDVLDSIMPILQCCGATVHVLSVRIDPASGTYKRDRLRFDPETAIAQTVAGFERELSKYGLEIETAMRAGTPNSEILKYASEHDVDMIIMMTHGRTGLNRYLQGSVTEQVIRRASVPVMVMRLDQAE